MWLRSSRGTASVFASLSLFSTDCASLLTTSVTVAPPRMNLWNREL